VIGVVGDDQWSVAEVVWWLARRMEVRSDGDASPEVWSKVEKVMVIGGVEGYFRQIKRGKRSRRDKEHIWA
jgi:hypothetical protein